MDDLDHWNLDDHECNYCSSEFSTEEDLREHEVVRHFYCDDCDRHFDNYNNIKMHRNSKIHRAADAVCPFCKMAHQTATGLMHHLERGNCPKAPLDRARMYEAIQRRDPKGILAKRFLTWKQDVKYEATELAYNYNEEAYECYLCKRLFQSLASLNQHLSSPVHQQDLYHCPNSKCKKNFTTLAGVINHLESEACNFMRFDAVQSTTQRILDPTRLIKF